MGIIVQAHESQFVLQFILIVLYVVEFGALSRPVMFKQGKKNRVDHFCVDTAKASLLLKKLLCAVTSSHSGVHKLLSV